MASNELIMEIIGILIECMLATEDKAQFERFSKLLDRFNMLIKIRGESNKN